MDTYTTIQARPESMAQSIEEENAYTYYMVIRLPNPNDVFDEFKRPNMGPEDFLSKCLLSAAQTNENNLLQQHENNSRFYFSDKAKAQSYRIPHTFNQLPSTFFDSDQTCIGIIGLQIYRNEKPEVKGFHQRVVALKDVFNRNRVTSLYVSENYPGLDFLGDDKSIPIEPPNNGFRQIEINF